MHLRERDADLKYEIREISCYGNKGRINIRNGFIAATVPCPRNVVE